MKKSQGDCEGLTLQYNIHLEEGQNVWLIDLNGLSNFLGLFYA